MNEADEQELRELRFKVGDALPADDPLARFILVVSMGLNDNSLSNTRFVNTKEPYDQFLAAYLEKRSRMG